MDTEPTRRNDNLPDNLSGNITVTCSIGEAEKLWIHRGELIALAALSLQKHSSYTWAGLLVLAGGALITLAIFGVSEPPGELATFVDTSAYPLP